MKSGSWLSIRAFCLSAGARGGRARGRTLPLLLSPWKERSRPPAGALLLAMQLGGHRSAARACASASRERQSLAPATHAARMKAAVLDERQRGSGGGARERRGALAADDRGGLVNEIVV